MGGYGVDKGDGGDVRRLKGVVLASGSVNRTGGVLRYNADCAARFRLAPE